MLINPSPPDDVRLRDLVDICRGAWIVLSDRDHDYFEDVVSTLPMVFLVVFGVVAIALGFAAGVAFGYLLRGLP
jgi:hypothetical protein